MFGKSFGIKQPPTVSLTPSFRSPTIHSPEFCARRDNSFFSSSSADIFSTMDSLPTKPLSSQGGRDRDRDQTKNRNRNHRRSRRSGDGDRDRDRDKDRTYSRRHRRRRSTSPAQPSSKRPRMSNASHKGKEPIRNGDPEPGEINIKAPEIGDDFIPFGASDTEASPREKPRSERARQKEKATEREWDIGKPPRMDDREGRGMKRKSDSAFDEEDDRGHRRRQRFESYDNKKTPWVSQVDWDSCHNVADMYVFPD